MNNLRTRIETAIEGLVALLDAIDGESDLEDSGDNEPSLSTGTYNWIPTRQSTESVDCELDYGDIGRAGKMGIEANFNQT